MKEQFPVGSYCRIKKGAFVWITENNIDNPFITEAVDGMKVFVLGISGPRSRSLDIENVPMPYYLPIEWLEEL